MRLPRRALPALAVVLLVVVAGCSAVPSGTPAGDAANETTADAGTTTAEPSTPSLDEVDLPPGVRENRTVPEPLLASHGAALRDANHTVVRETTFRTALGNRTTRIRARFAADGRFAVTSSGRSRAANASRAANVSIESYVGEERIYRKRTINGSTAYRVDQRTQAAVVTERNRAGSVAIVRTLLGAARFAPTGVRVEDGTTLVVLRATGDGLTSMLGVGNASAVRATMLVTERGVVREVSLTVDGAEDEGLESYAFALRVEAVGETAVEEPAWLDEALAASGGSGESE